MSPFDRRHDAVSVTRLHSVLTPHAGMPSALYLAEGSRVEVSAEGVFRLPPRGRLETDSYFNAFYLNVWRAHVPLERIGVQCRVRGVVALRVLAHLAGGGVRVIDDWMEIGAGEESLRWIWARVPEVGATEILRLSLSLATVEGAEIEDLAFVTDPVAGPAPRLVVGICTMNREPLLEETLAALAALADGVPWLQRVVVVNHGRPFQRADLRRLLAKPLFRTVEQANLGGSGGFARAMLEAQEGEREPTHLLLMDDDIRLDPRMILRALAFAQVAGEVAVGGQALELERPQRLQEAWGRLGRNWLPMVEGAGVDLSDPAAMRLWAKVPQADYNGWWFCLMPMSALRRCGLPIPCFIRGDDIEYGLRLRAAGVPVVPLPGVGVWHASVRYKHAGVVHYYDLRNSLITAAAHPEIGDLPGVLHVLGYVLHHLLVHRYRSAGACLLALRDFLDGPDAALSADAARLHRRLMKFVEAIPAPPRREVDPARMLLPEAFAVKAPDPRPVDVLLLVILVLFRPAQKDIRLLQKGAPDPMRLRGLPYFLALDPQGKTCLELRPHRWRFLTFLAQALWLCGQYAMWRGSARQSWTRALPRLLSRDRWLREFATRRH